MSTFYALIIIIAVVSIILSMPSLKGKIGEAKVAFLLDRLDKKKYIVINDLLIPTENGRTTQIDHVVVSSYGIFVIETKNYQGWIFGDEKNKYWTQQIYKRKERFYNPIWQNFGHIKSLENILRDSYDGPFYSIVTFSSKATLKKLNVRSSNVHVINTMQIIKTMKKYQQAVLHMNDVKRITNDLKAFASKDKAANKHHVKQIKETQKQERQKVKSNVCPKCGGDLVVRKGKYGDFMGCSNFPKCRFVSKKAAR